ETSLSPRPPAPCRAEAERRRKPWADWMGRCCPCRQNHYRAVYGLDRPPWGDWVRRCCPCRKNHSRAVYALDRPPWGGAHWGEVLMKKRSGSEKRRAT